MIRSPDDIRFAADVMVGKLARWLRALGYDTFYNVNLDPPQLIAVAKTENRILLTRSGRIVENNPDCETFLIIGNEPRQQLSAVQKEFQLGREWIFTRCTLCNAAVEKITSEQAEGKIPPNVLQNATNFYRCPVCGRFYWEGSHIHRFKEFLDREGA